MNLCMLQAAEEMVRFQLRHGNDLLAMDSLRDVDVSLCTQSLGVFSCLSVFGSYQLVNWT